jgi:hypothetical protein
MRVLAVLFVLFPMLLTSASGDDATESMLTDLEAGLRNLEAEAGGIEEAPRELVDRIERIREEATYLRVKMRKHLESGRSGTGVSEEEVESLTEEIASLRRELRQIDSDPPSGARALPEGSEVSVRLSDTLTTKTAQVGDRFVASLVEPATHLGELVLPAGARFHGVVELVDRAEGRTDRKARMVLELETVEVDGRRFPVEATVIDASGDDLETGIGDEKKKVGIAAGIGTILGAVVGGKKGAVVGAVLGGAGSILATEGEEVLLERGAILRIRLDRELRMESESSDLQ